MLEQLRNLSNPPGAFGSHQGALLGMTVVSVLLMFAGPALWAVIYLLNERSGRGAGRMQPVEADVQGNVHPNKEDDREHLKAA